MIIKKDTVEKIILVILSLAIVVVGYFTFKDGIDPSKWLENQQFSKEVLK